MGKKPKYIPAIGEKSYCLTVIDNSEQYINRPSGKKRAVLCKCICGTIKLIELKRVTSKNDKEKTKTCGCGSLYLGQSRNSVRGSHPNKFNWDLFRSYKSGANKRNLKFELTEEQFIELINQNCYYCGNPPNNRFRNGIEFNLNGIDRLDSLIGYTLDNCIPSCRICNNMKWEYPKDDFLNQVKLIIEHNNWT